MSPVVYLFEQQIIAHFKKSGNKTTVVNGDAYGWDYDSVFHAYLNSPLLRPAGLQASCVFILSGSSSLFSETDTHIQKLRSEYATSKEALLIFLVMDGKKILHKAFLLKESALMECEVKFVPAKSELFSRSHGLLETDVLARKSMGIVGLGSGGSPIAVELAKAGVGKFVLIDFDRIELSNVARHICGINDLGRFKTNAVRGAIRQKNPYAEVKTLEMDVTRHRAACAEALSGVDLIIAATDNDRSRFFLNEVALKYRIPAIFGRAITRAAGGDVMRVRPFEGPCYSCLYSQHLRPTGDDEEISQESQAKKLLPDYTSEKELHKVIQVGLASDIAPISNFMVKLALVELSRGLDTGIKSLEDDLVADFYIWANRRENVYEHWHKLEFNYNKPSILRWYGARVQRDPNCLVCGDGAG
ncbi:MAG TPA: ThiF family adenylyltransferase [Chitinophagales bacterium]|nr:ThiF family adenylyltransferase [Chitinophagales bacterium]